MGEGVSDRFVILQSEAPREILTVTPDGYFVRGKNCTDEEYLSALQRFSEEGWRWDGKAWVKNSEHGSDA